MSGTAGSPPPDPWTDFIDRARLDIDIAYQPDVLEALYQMQEKEPARFRQIYAGLRTIKGFNAELFKKALKRIAAANAPLGEPDTATLLVKVAEAAETFLDTCGAIVYSSFSVNNDQMLMTVPVQSE